MTGIETALKFLEDSKALGYQIKDSVFRIDYNGKTFNVGFWIRPCNWNQEKDKYDLPGRCGSAKNADFDTAVKMAMGVALTTEEAWK